MVKYVFVTGGVVSGLGKGITAASLGRLLKARGYQVTMQIYLPKMNCQSFFQKINLGIYKIPKTDYSRKQVQNETYDKGVRISYGRF